MDQDYIEKMAREYAEMLRAHDLKKTQSIVPPSQARQDYVALAKKQLRATRYLLSIAKTPVKKRLLLAIERELYSSIDEPYYPPKTNYANAENALAMLVDAELSKIEKLDWFEAPQSNTTKKYFVLTMLSLLSF